MRGRDRQISVSEQNTTAAAMTTGYRVCKDNIHMADRCRQRCSSSSLTTGKYKPDPGVTTSLRRRSSTEEEGNRDPWWDTSMLRLMAIGMVSANH